MNDNLNANNPNSPGDLTINNQPSNTGIIIENFNNNNNNNNFNNNVNNKSDNNNENSNDDEDLYYNFINFDVFRINSGKLYFINSIVRDFNFNNFNNFYYLDPSSSSSSYSKTSLKSKYKYNIKDNKKILTKFNNNNNNNNPKLRDPTPFFTSSVSFFVFYSSSSSFFLSSSFVFNVSSLFSSQYWAGKNIFVFNTTFQNIVVDSLSNNANNINFNSLFNLMLPSSSNFSFFDNSFVNISCCSGLNFIIIIIIIIIICNCIYL
jgi:hypothetical protein